jgi:hypothetical protein
MFGKRKGQSNMVGAMIGIMIVIIIDIVVVVPTVQDVIDNGNFTGATATVLGIVPLLLVLLPVIAVVAMYKFR